MSDAYYNSRSSDGVWQGEQLLAAGFNYPCGAEDWNGVLWAVAYSEVDEVDGKSSLHLFRSIDNGDNWSDLGTIIGGVKPQVAGLEFQVL